MKKILFISAAAVLMAASCDYQSIGSIFNTKSPVPAASLAPGTVANQDFADGKSPDLTGWKTYRYEELNFKISYPAQFEVEENPTDLPTPEDQPDQFKNTILILNNQNSTDPIKGLVYIQKVHASVKSENQNLFNWFLTSMTKVPSVDYRDQYFLYDYFSGSASDSNRVYFIPKDGPTSPADNAEIPTDILVARVMANSDSATTSTLPQVTLLDVIARTLSFIK